MTVLNYVNEKCWTELAAIKTPQRNKVHQLPMAIKSLCDIRFLLAHACTNKMHLTTTASSRSFLSCVQTYIKVNYITFLPRVAVLAIVNIRRFVLKAKKSTLLRLNYITYVLREAKIQKVIYIYVKCY